MRTRRLAIGVVAALTLAGCSGGGGSSSPKGSEGPSAFPQMTGTATEKKLCSDLRNGASTVTLYKDTKRVYHDIATIPDHLGIASATFVTSTRGPRDLPPDHSIASGHTAMTAVAVRPA